MFTYFEVKRIEIRRVSLLEGMNKYNGKHESLSNKTV
mgnify:CR=1 FL=1